MQYEKISIEENDSGISSDGSIIISIRYVSSDRVECIMGSPGMSNIEKKMAVGDSVIFENSVSGAYELRLSRISYDPMNEHTQINEYPGSVDVILTKISSSLGSAIGLGEIEPNNVLFSVEEKQKITSSVEEIKRVTKNNLALQDEVLDLIFRKLDEVNKAANRIGRKDWINYTVGVLTSIIIQASLDRETASAFMKIVNDALGWIFGEVLKLLP